MKNEFGEGSAEMAQQFPAKTQIQLQAGNTAFQSKGQILMARTQRPMPGGGRTALSPEVWQGEGSSHC